MASGKAKTAARRQSSKRRLPSSHVQKRRTYLFYYSLPFIHLKIISRNFIRKDKSYGRRLRLYLFNRREIIVAPAREKPVRRKPANAAPQRHWHWQTAAAAFILIAGGIGGGWYSISHLQKQRSFDIAPTDTAKVLAVHTPVSYTKVMAKSEPTELIIPKIGLDTMLAKTGLDGNGAVAMPWDIDTAAWYEYSPTPGQLGPAVIVGHLDGANYANLTGIFWRLHELEPGDEISVNRADGSVANFKVLYLKNVSQANFPTQEIYGNINYAGLRVITCGGTFDAATGHYTKNTVVFAALE